MAAGGQIARFKCPAELGGCGAILPTYFLGTGEVWCRACGATFEISLTARLVSAGRAGVGGRNAPEGAREPVSTGLSSDQCP